MILKAKHHFFLYPFFSRYVNWKMNREFYAFHFNGEFNDKRKPILVIGNHVSWWDGIWALKFNQLFLKRKFHFMMLEDQLRKNWFFQYTGGFSIKKKSKTIIETISYTSELLSDANNMVLLFPTGKIQSIHNRTFIFEKGTEKILQKIKNEIQVVFMVNFIDYFSQSKPSLFLYYQEYSGNYTLKELQHSFNLFYLNCSDIQKEKVK